MIQIELLSTHLSSKILLILMVLLLNSQLQRSHFVDGFKISHLFSKISQNLMLAKIVFLVNVHRSFKTFQTFKLFNQIYPICKRRRETEKELKKLSSPSSLRLLMSKPTFSCLMLAIKRIMIRHTQQHSNLHCFLNYNLQLIQNQKCKKQISLLILLLPFWPSNQSKQVKLM